MTSEIEILKIGSILPPNPISGSTVYDTSQFRTQTIMIVSDGGPIIDHYVSILKKETSGYSFLKTQKKIVGGPFSYRPGNNDSRLIGELDGEIVIGMSFAVGNWHSSVVEKIIDNNIIITKNSVYVIHNISQFRDKKIESLGI
jgi:hypothetical protein